LAGEGDSSIVQGNMYFPFSTLVFGSWDFHITNVEAAKKLRRGIRMQVTTWLSRCLVCARLQAFVTL
jgi:hypothetical protein